MLSSGAYPAPDNENADIDLIVPNGATGYVTGRFDYTTAYNNNAQFYGKLKITLQNVTDGWPEQDLTSAGGSLATGTYTFTDPFGGGYATYTPGSAVASASFYNGTGAAKLYRMRIYVASNGGGSPGNGVASISGSY